MASQTQMALEAWKEAAEEAKAAERKLSQAWDACIVARTPPPDDVILEVRRLHEETNRRLQELVDRAAEEATLFRTDDTTT